MLSIIQSAKDYGVSAGKNELNLSNMLRVMTRMAYERTMLCAPVLYLLRPDSLIRSDDAINGMTWSNCEQASFSAASLVG
jgi:hypothetical protein